MSSTDTPKNSGFIMPAEWEPHEAVWLAWPYDKISFGSLNQKNNQFNPERLPKIETQFKKIIDALASSETVNLIVRDVKNHSEIKNARLFEADYADVWTRDYIPAFVKTNKGKLAAVKWNYDAYGEQFADLMKDNNVWTTINQQLKIDTFEPKIILESGAIESNGNGTLLTTEQCLLKRNQNLTKTDYENIFADHLGISRVIWLNQGLANDHTHGHVDEIARFVAPNKIVCAYEDNPADKNYPILKENFEILQQATDLDGKPFEVIKLPMPHLDYDDGNKAPVSYANFYIGNSVTLASIFKDPNDEKALKILQDCFPDRKVVPIDCSDIIYGGGAIHCMTQQQPQ